MIDEQEQPAESTAEEQPEKATPAEEGKRDVIGQIGGVYPRLSRPPATAGRSSPWDGLLWTGRAWRGWL